MSYPQKMVCHINTRSVCSIGAVLIIWGCLHVAYGQGAPRVMYVGNQGNFADANGTVTLYDLENRQVEQDIAPGINTLVQSITLHDGKVYIVGNTSDRIDVVDSGTHERIGQITGILSPRYMTVTGDDKAYVSNLNTASVTVVHLGTLTVEGTIRVGSNPEGIAVVNNRAFVANFGFGSDSTLTVINVQADSVLETRSIGCDGPRFLEADTDEELWVFCNGKTVFNEDFTEIVEQTNGEVVVLDTQTDEIVARIKLDAQSGTASLGQDAWHDPVTKRMFLIEGTRILVFDTSANQLQDSIQIPGEEQMGAVAYDPLSDRLYLGRITDFTSQGFVSIHDLQGNEVDRFTAGIAPASIALVQPPVPVSLDDPHEAVMGAFRLEPAYPNPALMRTSFPFEVNRTAALKLDIFNTLGKKVETLVDEMLSPGRYTVEWRAGEVPAGMYYYRLSSQERVETGTLIIIH